jgi:hypothetical protein
MKLWHVGTAIVALALLASSGFAQRSHIHSSRSLRGLRGVYVDVHYVGNRDPVEGLSEEQIASEVALRLNVAGIAPLSEEKWSRTPGKPYLYVDVVGTPLTTVDQQRTGYDYVCSIDLIQQVSLERMPEMTVEGCTWSRGSSVVVPQHDLSLVRTLIGNLASMFTESVQSANRSSRETAGGT